ncbi:MAG TPA: thiamine phosphate synthase [Methylomirabilota bacterium]|nr:thiamine phosphate synthase [Methylomirabilota bacterium]
MPAPDFDLYLVTDRTQTQGRDLLWVLAQALEGGVRSVQLREKDLSGKELFALAEQTRKLCQRFHALLFVNERIDVALAVEADGVQLGNASIPIEVARELLGPRKIIGVSTHSLEEAKGAEQSGADFILFGPVYFTPSKATYGAPQGLPALKKIVDKTSLPVYAIGGLKPENVEDVMRTGSRGVALISAVMNANNPKAAAQRILSSFQR